MGTVKRESTHGIRLLAGRGGLDMLGLCMYYSHIWSYDPIMPSRPRRVRVTRIVMCPDPGIELGDDGL